jgi:DNA polymerase-1
MIITTKEKAKEFIESIPYESMVSIDTECEEFTKEKDHSFDLGLYGIGLYLNEKNKAYITTEALPDNFQNFLNKCTFIFHNAKFDLTIIEKQGYDISKLKYHDTLIMSWLVNESRRSHKLKDLAESILKVNKATKFKELTKKPLMEDYQIIPSQFPVDFEKWRIELGEYCILDCKYTYKLFQKFQEKVKKDNLQKVYENLELPFINVLRKMENRGVSIDTEYLRVMGSEMEQEIIRIQSEIWKLAGKEVDINSPKQLSEIFFKEKKYELPNDYRTPKGEYSTDVESLTYLSEKYNCELSKKILEYREMFKLYSTYILGLLEKQRNGVIYASFSQTGTVTGRLSSSSPNLQNLPARDDKFNIRKAFIPRQGYTFITADYSQIELRILAYFSKDPVLVEAYKEGKDIHKATADILGCERKTAKAVNFGIIYGQTDYGLSKGLGISLEEAKKFIDGYMNKFKSVAIFQQKAINTLQRNYAVWTILGRRRHFPKYAEAKKKKDWKAMGGFHRQATNTVIQGSASDLIKVAMRNLDKKLLNFDAHILIQVHDELIIEVPENRAEELLPIVKFEMEHALDLSPVPIIVEPKINKIWSK